MMTTHFLLPIYFTPCLTFFFMSRISLMAYSRWSSSMVGGKGGGCNWEGKAGALHGVSKTSLNMSWICHAQGSRKVEMISSRSNLLVINQPPYIICFLFGYGCLHCHSSVCTV